MWINSGKINEIVLIRCLMTVLVYNSAFCKAAVNMDIESTDSDSDSDSDHESSA